ncbi:unnamed protein product [Caenorhabditis auriculariae]|uniref:Uncharacterized protein n=1 Tax=Caenorhabditis auriculariae TaxID=2777116 RepID=A0A8S1GTH1_9PELO|nr:unnamed protein product [Caenorhabditis auriculariae]
MSQTGLTNAQITTLENYVQSFKVIDLQKILEACNCPKVGKKAELIHRVTSLLRTQNQSFVAERIEMTRRGGLPSNRSAPYNIPNNNQRGYMGAVNHQMRYPPAYGAPTNGAVYGGGATMHSGQALASGRLNPVQNLKPIPLPFYDPVDTIQPLLELPAVQSGIKSTQRQTVTFSLTAAMCQQLAQRDKPIPRHELQLRSDFNLNNDFMNSSISPSTTQKGPQMDDFPLNASVRVDENIVTLPNVIPTNKPNAEPKRPSRPVNLSTYCMRPDPAKTYRLTIEWMGDRRAWAFGIYYVFRVNSDILRDRAIKDVKHKQSSDATKKEISKRLGGSDDDDDGPIMDHLKISLLCPLSKTRMELPARCRDCTHLQCFDLNMYLQMNEKRPTWKCAVCSQTAAYDRLIIDEYFSDVLKAVHSSTSEVELKKDGSYEVCKVESASDDDDDNDDGNSRPTSRNPNVSNSGGPSTSSAVQDIIVLSDSDDDDVREAVRQSVGNETAEAVKRSASDQREGSSTSSAADRAKKKRPAVTNNKPRVQEFDVITLDDSPPRPPPASRIEARAATYSNEANGRVGSTDGPRSAGSAPAGTMSNSSSTSNIREALDGLHASDPQRHIQQAQIQQMQRAAYPQQMMNQAYPGEMRDPTEAFFGWYPTQQGQFVGGQATAAMANMPYAYGVVSSQQLMQQMTMPPPPNSQNRPPMPANGTAEAAAEQFFRNQRQNGMQQNGGGGGGGMRVEEIDMDIDLEFDSLGPPLSANSSTTENAIPDSQDLRFATILNAMSTTNGEAPPPDPVTSSRGDM